MKQSGFFDVEERLARLSGLSDQLEAFPRTVNFEVFRKALAYSDGSKGGCRHRLRHQLPSSTCAVPFTDRFSPSDGQS
jgi:hypothetical protein